MTRSLNPLSHFHNQNSVPNLQVSTPRAVPSQKTNIHKPNYGVTPSHFAPVHQRTRGAAAAEAAGRCDAPPPSLSMRVAADAMRVMLQGEEYVEVR